MRGKYASLSVVSTATNYIMEQDNVMTHTYRTYIKPRESGQLELRFWHINSVDSTWDVGSVAQGSMPGGEWWIEDGKDASVSCQRLLEKTAPVRP